MVVGEPLVNLELHALDLLNSSDGLSPLAPHQRDLRIPLTDKLHILTAAVASLRGAGYGFSRLDEAAAEVTMSVSGRRSCGS
jgi:hypothetical protein